MQLKVAVSGVRSPTKAAATLQGVFLRKFRWPGRVARAMTYWSPRCHCLCRVITRLVGKPASPKREKPRNWPSQIGTAARCDRLLAPTQLIAIQRGDRAMSAITPITTWPPCG